MFSYIETWFTVSNSMPLEIEYKVKLNSVESRDVIYVKGYELLSFIKNIRKNVSSKYGQKLLENIKKTATDALKIASKREGKKQKKQLVI